MEQKDYVADLAQKTEHMRKLAGRVEEMAAKLASFIYEQYTWTKEREQRLSTAATFFNVGVPQSGIAIVNAEIQDIKEKLDEYARRYKVICPALSLDDADEDEDEDEDEDWKQEPFDPLDQD